MSASSLGRLDVVKLLLEAKAQVNLTGQALPFLGVLYEEPINPVFWGLY